MSYLVSDLITEIKLRAKDSSLSDDLIISYLQDKQDEVLGGKAFPFMEIDIQEVLSLNIQQYDYDLTAPTVLDISLRDQDNNNYIPLEYVPYRQFKRNFFSIPTIGKGIPSFWTQYAQSIYFDCYTNKEYLLDLLMLSASNTLSTSSTPDIPKDFKNIYINAGLAGVERYRENFDVAAVYERKVEDLVENLNLRYSTRQMVRTSKATTARSYVGNGKI